eukprot:gene24629-29756_t
MEYFDADKTVQHIAMVIAMEAEAAPFLKAFDLQPYTFREPMFLPCQAYQGKISDDSIVSVIVFGKDRRFNVDSVGTTAAALATYIAIKEFNPDLILSTGTAGGFKRVGAQIGDCFVGTTFVHHDRRIAIPGFDAYGIGQRHGPSCFNLIKERSDLGLKSGVVTSGNSLDYHDMDMKIMVDCNAAVKEMEVASIAYVADHARIPVMAIKVVTDIVDGDRPSHEEFLENLHAASRSLQDHLPKVVKYIGGKKISDL